jgi:hypothetical protein
MWAREPTEVRGNLREVKKLLEKGSVHGYAPESLVVPAGPFPLRDDQLVLVAYTMMLRLLDAVKNEPPYAKCRFQLVEGVARWSDGVGDDAGYNEFDYEHVSNKWRVV